jgi:hypothetical protein
VNLASRVEGLSEPGTICVTEDIFKLTEGLFRFESLGEKHIKGKENLIRIYRVIAPSTRRTRFDVSAELYRRDGQNPKAKDYLNKAADIFSECGADGWVVGFEKAFASPVRPSPFL